MNCVVRQLMHAAMKAAISLPIWGLILAFGATDSLADTRIVFGAYAYDRPSEIVVQLNPTLKAISRKIEEMSGEKVTFRMQIVQGYKRGVDDLVAKRFDVMRLGPASYVMAKRRAPEISILAMEKMRGRNAFNGIIAVHRDSPIIELSQLRGRSFAFGSKRSTLGRFFAQLTLARAGILAKDLKSFEYLGRHDRVGRAVGAKLFEAGALEETVFAYLRRRGVPIRALAKYSNATRPWIVREGLDPALAGKIRMAMLAITDRTTLQALRFEGFVPGADDDYEPTRQAIAGNRIFFEGFSKDPSGSTLNGTTQANPGSAELQSAP